MRTDHGAGTLADRLRLGPLSRLELEQLAQDLLAMLASLHAEGTLHRDLNPGSVRLDGAGRLHSSKIGAQRGAGTAAEAIGPQDYVAPEVRAGADGGVAADLFACGALLAAAAGPDAPAPVLVLIGMLTAAEPDLRPASAAEALALLGAAPAPPAPPAPRAPAPGYRQTFEKPGVAAPALPSPALPSPALPSPALPAPSRPVPAPQDVPTEPIRFPPLTAYPAIVDTPPTHTRPHPVVPAAPAVVTPPPAVAYPRRRFGRRAVGVTVGAVLALLVVVGGAVALGGGEDSATTEIPAPAAAPLDQQLDDLDAVIDTLGR